MTCSTRNCPNLASEPNNLCEECLDLMAMLLGCVEDEDDE